MIERAPKPTLLETVDVALSKVPFSNNHGRFDSNGLLSEQTAVQSVSATRSAALRVAVRDIQDVSSHGVARLTRLVDS
jgi:hypothetical protein